MKTITKIHHILILLPALILLSASCHTLEPEMPAKAEKEKKTEEKVRRVGTIDLTPDVRFPAEQGDTIRMLANKPFSFVVELEGKALDIAWVGWDPVWPKELTGKEETWLRENFNITAEHSEDRTRWIFTIRFKTAREKALTMPITFYVKHAVKGTEYSDGSVEVTPVGNTSEPQMTKDYYEFFFEHYSGKVSAPEIVLYNEAKLRKKNKKKDGFVIGPNIGDKTHIDLTFETNCPDYQFNEETFEIVPEEGSEADWFRADGFDIISTGETHDGQARYIPVTVVNTSGHFAPKTLYILQESLPPLPAEGNNITFNCWELKNALLHANAETVDTDGDGEISFAEAESVTRIDLPEKTYQVSDLEGIQHFKNIETLRIKDGTFTDMSMVKDLKKIHQVNVTGNKGITGDLDISGLTFYFDEFEIDTDGSTPTLHAYDGQVLGAHGYDYNAVLDIVPIEHTGVTDDWSRQFEFVQIRQHTREPHAVIVMFMTTFTNHDYEDGSVQRFIQDYVDYYYSREENLLGEYYDQFDIYYMVNLDETRWSECGVTEDEYNELSWEVNETNTGWLHYAYGPKAWEKVQSNTRRRKEIVKVAYEKFLLGHEYDDNFANLIIQEMSFNALTADYWGGGGIKGFVPTPDFRPFYKFNDTYRPGPQLPDGIGVYPEDQESLGDAWEVAKKGTYMVTGFFASGFLHWNQPQVCVLRGPTGDSYSVSFSKDTRFLPHIAFEYMDYVEWDSRNHEPQENNAQSPPAKVNSIKSREAVPVVAPIMR